MNVGIIGGADGPTAIFVSSSTSPIWLIAAAVIVVGVVVGFVFWKRNK